MATSFSSFIASTTSAIVEKSREAIVSRVLDTLGLAKTVAPLVRLGLRGWAGFSEAITLEWLEKRHVSREED